METEGGEQSAEEGAADRTADPTDRPLLLSCPSPRDARRSQPAQVSVFGETGDTVPSEEGSGQPEAKQCLRAVPGGRETKGCGLIIGFCLESELLANL